MRIIKYGIALLGIYSGLALCSCQNGPANTATTPPTVGFNDSAERQQINTVLDGWHAAAAKADFTAYFAAMADSSIFIGTDATENWNKPRFMTFAKPYFDKGKAWSFTSLQRNLFLDASGHTAWFDELLSTQMKICRGSGVLSKEGNAWKIRHYVLSVTVPNEQVDQVTKMKTAIEDSLMNQLNKR
jgi:ketosteroid isomerase-like protein